MSEYTEMGNDIQQSSMAGLEPAKLRLMPKSFISHDVMVIRANQNMLTSAAPIRIYLCFTGVHGYHKV